MVIYISFHMELLKINIYSTDKNIFYFFLYISSSWQGTQQCNKSPGYNFGCFTIDVPKFRACFYVFSLNQLLTISFHHNFPKCFVFQSRKPILLFL